MRIWIWPNTMRHRAENPSMNLFSTMKNCRKCQFSSKKKNSTFQNDRNCTAGSNWLVQLVDCWVYTWAFRCSVCSSSYTTFRCGCSAFRACKKSRKGDCSSSNRSQLARLCRWPQLIEFERQWAVLCGRKVNLKFQTKGINDRIAIQFNSIH